MVEGRPVLPVADVHGWAARFGLCKEGEQLSFVKELPSYDDLNFHVKAHSGKEYVIKAHNGVVAAGSLQRLEAQNRFICRLKDAGVAVPSVVAAPDGTTIMSMASPGAPEANQKAHVRVLMYLPGDLAKMSDPKSDRFCQAVGAMCGRMTSILSGFEDKAAVWDWDWNMTNVVSACKARVHHVKQERQALAHQFIGSYGKALNPDTLAKLPHSVIHSDLNDTNLLFKGEEVSGVIDFGDSIHSCTIFELGIAAGYCAMGQDDPLRVFCEALRGYLREASLSDLELEVLYHVAYGRVLLSATFSAESCAAEPDNEYLAHTSEPGWAVLTKLKDVAASDVLAMFKKVQAEVTSAAVEPPLKKQA